MATLDWLPDRRTWRVRWHATDRKTGRTFSGSRCLKDKPSAAQLWADREAEEKAFRLGVEPAAGETLADAARQFESYCLRHTRRTQDLYRRTLRRFLAALPPGVAAVADLRPRHIEDYLFALSARKLSNRSLNIQLTVVKAFCRFVSRRSGLANPAAQVQMLHEDPPNSRFLTAEEYTRLLDHADPLNRDRLIFLANTGLRATEFSTLVASGQLRTPHLAAVTIVGKGRKRRTVPLNAAARDTLTRPLIHRPCGRTGLLQAFHKIAQRAAIPPLGPHALRHLFATRMLLAGVPIAVVAKLLGHSVRVCETTYSHILPQDVAHVTDVLAQR